MVTRSTKGEFDVVTSIAPAVHTTTQTGTTVDLKGVSAATVVIQAGAIVAAGNVTPKLQHGDLSDGSDAADVAAADLAGSFTNPIAANTVQRVGYRGAKRYIRVVGTHNSGTSVAYGATVVRQLHALEPVA